MKKVLFLLLSMMTFWAKAQTIDSATIKLSETHTGRQDTAQRNAIPSKVVKDTVKKAADSTKQSTKTTGKDTAAAQPIINTKDTTSIPAAVKENNIIKSLSEAALRWDPSKINLSLFFPKPFLTLKSTQQYNIAIMLHKEENNDLLFFCFAGILLFFGIVKLCFPKYFNHIFWFFLQPDSRKKGGAEQQPNRQHIIPSFLLNLFFVVTGGLFVAQVSMRYWTTTSFWTLWLSFASIILIIYLIKYLVIKFSGWMFNTPVAAATYNNVVFSINKIIGLLLLPATILIAYGSAQTVATVYSFVSICIAILLLYRYIASFMLIKGKLKVNAFHFILYLCAVEIIPLLLAYKVLLTNIGRII